MNEEIKQVIREILDYTEPGETEHYEQWLKEERDPKKHIGYHLKKAREFLENPPITIGRTISFSLYKGLVTDVEGLEPQDRLLIRDYDIHGDDDPDLHKDAKGNKYLLIVHRNE